MSISSDVIERLLILFDRPGCRRTMRGRPELWAQAAAPGALR